jgi:hypothetical protein
MEIAFDPVVIGRKAVVVQILGLGVIN